MFRKDRLCPGAGECPDVLMADPRADWRSPPCEECPVSKLDEYLASGAGRWIREVIDLDFALHAGVTVSLSEIPYPEFLLLRLLGEERARFHEEEMKKASRNGR